MNITTPLMPHQQCAIDKLLPTRIGALFCDMGVGKSRMAIELVSMRQREGLVLEAEKMRHLLRNCALELREMDMMVAYRKDEGRVAQVKFYPRSPRNSKE